MKKMVFFILVISFSFIAKISASDLNREYLTDIYFVQENNSGHYLSGIQSLFTIDNNIVYCIEPTAKINSYNYDKFSINESNLNSEQLEYLELLGKYGYRHGGQNDIKYYLATQELIWEYLSGFTVYYTTKQYGYGDYINLDYEKTVILNNISNQYRNNYTQSYNYFSKIGDTVLITDINNLNEYEYSNTIHTVNINDSNLNIILNSDFVGSSNIQLTLKDNYKSKVYKSDNSQTFAYLNYNKLKNIDLNFNSIGEEILIQQVHDFDYPINDNLNHEGAIYQVLNNKDEVIETITTDAFGVAMTNSNLTFGYYCLKQIKNSTGYNLIKDKICFDVNSGSSYEYKIIPVQPIIATLDLYVGIKNKNNLNPLENIKFKIIDENNNIIDSITTNEEGNATIKLIYGKYKIELVKQDENINFVYDIEINIQSEETIKKEIIKEVISNEDDPTIIDDEKVKESEENINDNIIETKEDINENITKMSFIVPDTLKNNKPLNFIWLIFLIAMYNLKYVKEN